MIKVQADRTSSAPPPADILAQCPPLASQVPVGTSATSLNPPYEPLSDLKTHARGSLVKEISLVERNRSGRNTPIPLASFLADAKKHLEPTAIIGLRGYPTLTGEELSAAARSSGYRIVHQPDPNKPGVVIYDPKGGKTTNPDGFVGDGGVGGMGCPIPAGYHPGTPRQTRA